MKLALIVPVLNRFDLFTELIESVDTDMLPIIIKNWENNRGVAASWNIGMQRAWAAGYRYAIIANDDTRFHSGTIDRLLNTIRDTGYCIVSSNPNAENDVDGLIEKKEFSNFIVDIPKLITFCGTFDENFTPAYFEDDDMFYRIKLSGKGVCLDTEAFVSHKGSATQNFDIDRPVCSMPQFDRNRSYYVKKWGGLPGQEEYVTPYGDSDKTIMDWNKI